MTRRCARTPRARAKPAPTLVLALGFALTLALNPGPGGRSGGIAHAQQANATRVPPPRVEFAVRGGQGLSERELLEGLEFWLDDLRQDPDDVAALNDAAYALEQNCQALGYLEATARAETEDAGRARRVVFRVSEGPLHVVDAVSFRGNSTLASEDLERAFPWKRRGLLGTGLLGTGERVYTPGARDEGLATIRVHYQLEGHGAVSVRWEESRKQDSEHVRVRGIVTIEEGPRTRLATIEFDGATPFTRDQLLSWSGVQPGQAFSRRLPVAAGYRLQRELRDRGYFAAEVHAKSHEAGSEVALTLRVETGPLYRIEALTVEGESTTDADWIEDRLPFRVGSLYRVTSLEEARRVLLATGLFRSVRVEAEPLTNDPHAGLHVRVRLDEKHRLRLSTTVGYGSYELARAGLEVFYRDLFGRGLEARLRGEVSYRGESTELRVRYPFFLEQRLALTVAGRYERFEEPSFIEQELALPIGLELEVGRRATVGMGYELRDAQIHDADPGLDPELTQDTRAALLYLEGSRDRRNDIFDPSAGTLLRARGEYAAGLLGSTEEFLRFEVRSTIYQTLVRRWVAVLNLRAGTLWPLQSDEVPLSERFYLGGSRSVRSFGYAQLGPRDARNNIIGGEGYVTANLELRFPVWGRIGAATFLDTGSLGSSVYDTGMQDYRHAAGVGLFYETPFGPLRVDGAGTLNPHSGDDRWAVHVLLGHPF